MNKKIIGPRINSGDIVKEIRELSTAWGDHYDDAIWNKFKLASDVQYVTIELFNQFCKENNIDPALIELFFQSKRNQ